MTMQNPDLPVIEQYAPPVAAAVPEPGLSAADAEGAMDAIERLVSLFDRVSSSMSQLIDARARALATRQPAAVPAQYSNGTAPAPRPDGLPPPPQLLRRQVMAAAPPQEMMMEQPATYATQAPPQPAPPEPAPPAELTDAQIDSVFDLAIGWAEQYPETTFREAAIDLNANRALLRGVVRKAIGGG